jgi:hypothetical protein
MEAGPAPNRRRLPTKTRSGIITLPSPVPRDDEESITISPLMISNIVQSQCLDTESSTSPSIPASPKDDELCKTSHADIMPSSNHSGITSNTSRVESGLHVGSSTSTYGPPKQVPKPPPLKTGPLNSTSTPQAHALPVTRRGSYQSLKKQPNGGLMNENTPSVMGMLKKATHWEVRVMPYQGSVDLASL